MTWLDVLLYGPGWAALPLMALGKFVGARWDRDLEFWKEHGYPRPPRRDSTGWRWQCHLCANGDEGYLTRWGAGRVHLRHNRAHQRHPAPIPNPAPTVRR